MPRWVSTILIHCLKHGEVQGHKAYPDLDSLGKSVDLAVITTPATTVPGIIEVCGERGVRAAAILSAGFRETGPDGEKLEKVLVENARRFGLRFIGPNCLGVMRRASALTAPSTGAAQVPARSRSYPSRALCALPCLTGRPPTALVFRRWSRLESRRTLISASCSITWSTIRRLRASCCISKACTKPARS